MYKLPLRTKSVTVALHEIQQNRGLTRGEESKGIHRGIDPYPPRVTEEVRDVSG